MTVSLDGSLIHPVEDILQFYFLPDTSVSSIVPKRGSKVGGYPVFIIGSNFVNTSSLGCLFDDMRSRGIYVSASTVLCLAPAWAGRAQLASNSVQVEVTLNGYDYSDSRMLFDYYDGCEAGGFCLGGVRQLAPNGTFCPPNSNNFTLCSPGTFQPKEGQSSCLPCSVGFLCPDHGMSRPVVCYAGQVCDTIGLRAPTSSCPAGSYCPPGTKSGYLSNFNANIMRSTNNVLNTEDRISRRYSDAIGSSIDNFLNFQSVMPEYFHADNASGVTQWTLPDKETGLVTFIFESLADLFSVRVYPLPAIGSSQVLFPPIVETCDASNCTTRSKVVLAEGPLPCPQGYFCRAGVASSIPIPKNYSTPQKCYDGFYCPLGSISPEGTGPCPNGYFCPNDIDAIPCLPGTMCPGVGNTGPVDCNPGTYNPFSGRANCTVCPIGTLCPGYGSLSPEICPAGFICSSVGLSFPVILCPQGYFCEEGTITEDPAASTPHRPKPCPPGSW